MTDSRLSPYLLPLQLQPGCIAAFEYQSSWAIYIYICSHIDVQDPLQSLPTVDVGRPRRGDLANLARACRMFSSHVFPLLWNTVTLANLLRCLPVDSFELRTKGGYIKKRAMHLCRPLKESDFARLRVYTIYVKRLYSEAYYDDLSAVFPSVIGWLSKNRLPNLRALQWHHDDSELQNIYPFLTPRLTTISISIASPGALTLLPTLSLGTISAFIRELRNLEYLNIGSDIDDSALAHLAALSRIQELCLGQITSGPLSHNSESTFQGLRALSFIGAEIHSPIHFLAWCKKTPLVDFAAECPPSPSADDVHRLFLAVAGGINHSSLLHFSLGFDGDPFNPPDPSTLVQSASFRHLFSFINLVSVSIESSVGIDLDDAIVLEMARSWPRIETLELGSYYGTSNPRTTLRCLGAFPQYCPRLTKLCIAFDATVVPTSVQGLSLETSEEMDVEASPIVTAQPVAQFLANLFPNLGSIKTLAEEFDGDEVFILQALAYSELWKEVDSRPVCL